MKEYINGFDRFNQPWEAPEVHRQRFTDLLEGLAFVRFTYTRRRELGDSAGKLTAYYGVVEQEDLELVATARLQALLSGMKEALPALVVPISPSGAASAGRVFVQLAYTKPLNKPHPPRYEPPF